MGNIIRWAIPDLTEVTYTKTYIYKSDSRDGLYSELEIQNITDNTYFDELGTNENWYKISFRIGLDGVFSQLSDPIQGGTFNGYCSVYDIRTFSSSLPITKISDTILFEFIKFANAQINQDILTEHYDEQLMYISHDKQNVIDGLNKTFCLSNHYVADYNDDGLINELDIYCYGVDSSGVRTDYAVESIDNVRQGIFTLLHTPPRGTKLYVNYKSSPVLMSPTINRQVRSAAINYVLALAYSRTDPGQVKSFRVNKVSITGESSPAKKYMQEYSNIISKIVSSPVKEKSSSQNVTLRGVVS